MRLQKDEEAMYRRISHSSIKTYDDWKGLLANDLVGNSADTYFDPCPYPHA